MAFDDARFDSSLRLPAPLTPSPCLALCTDQAPLLNRHGRSAAAWSAYCGMHKDSHPPPSLPRHAARPAFDRSATHLSSRSSGKEMCGMSRFLTRGTKAVGGAFWRASHQPGRYHKPPRICAGREKPCTKRATGCWCGQTHLVPRVRQVVCFEPEPDHLTPPLTRRRRSPQRKIESTRPYCGWVFSDTLAGNQR
jgi:hypothetical protein